MSQKKILVYIGSPLLSLIVLTATAFAINTILEGYKAEKGVTTTSITVGTDCKKVTNNRTDNLPIFIPTRTASEWELFKENTTAYVSLGECATPPGAPQNLTGTANEQQVTLTWTDVTIANNGGATIIGYNVYGKSAEDGEYIKINASIVTNTSYINTGLTSGTVYYYQISAVNSAGEGPRSSAISVRTMTIVLNSISNKSCSQKCSEMSLVCVDMGNDVHASNGVSSWWDGSNCYDSRPSDRCGYVEKDRYTDFGRHLCGGNAPAWTNCLCR